jgi:hypothetical protein
MRVAPSIRFGEPPLVLVAHVEEFVHHIDVGEIKGAVDQAFIAAELRQYRAQQPFFAAVQMHQLYAV